MSWPNPFNSFVLRPFSSRYFYRYWPLIDCLSWQRIPICGRKRKIVPIDLYHRIVTSPYLLEMDRDVFVILSHRTEWNRKWHEFDFQNTKTFTTNRFVCVLWLPLTNQTIYHVDSPKWWPFRHHLLRTNVPIQNTPWATAVSMINYAEKVQIDLCINDNINSILISFFRSHNVQRGTNTA